MQKLKTGPGLEPGVDVGPLINQQALDARLRRLRTPSRAAARCSAAANGMAGSKGYFLEPTVIDGVTEAALCMREETFAPVAPITTFETEDEAIELANGSDYGLSAYAMTRDIGAHLPARGADRGGHAGHQRRRAHHQPEPRSAA